MLCKIGWERGFSKGQFSCQVSEIAVRNTDGWLIWPRSDGFYPAKLIHVTKIYFVTCL
jgi:hypothetical protein